jgi:hypothetical protein
VTPWLWLVLAVLAGAGAVFFAALGVSAGTAYGSNFHSLSPRQKWMGATLYRGSLLAAIGSGAIAVLAVVLAVRHWLA